MKKRNLGLYVYTFATLLGTESYILLYVFEVHIINVFNIQYTVQYNLCLGFT